jgi:hypothetical protein
VLERDGWRCQYPVGDGQVCGEYADTAGHHVTARVDGGLSTVANLRAECRRHNFSDGGRIGARKRAERRTPSFFRDGPCP